MENMLHLAPSHDFLPEEYAFSPDLIPPAISAAVSLPVIDLSRSRDEVCRATIDAGKEFGFFQVVNHGISEQALQDMRTVCEEFFQLPPEDKAHLYSEDKNRPNRLFSGSTYKNGGKKYWMDCLRLERTFPISDSKNEWPNKPGKIREVFENFTALTRGLGMELLQILCEGLGLRPDYFDVDLSGGNLVFTVNHYPPCPNPRLTLGLPPHCDRNLITLVLPSAVQGLEVFYNGDWVKVKPMLNTFVVNFGLQIEVVTNGILKSAEHRVITNTALGRTSIITGITGTKDCLIGPAEELLSENYPPRYRTIKFGDFLRIYSKTLEDCQGDLKQHMKPFMI